MDEQKTQLQGVLQNIINTVNNMQNRYQKQFQLQEKQIQVLMFLLRRSAGSQEQFDRLLSEAKQHTGGIDLGPIFHTRSEHDMAVLERSISEVIQLEAIPFEHDDPAEDDAEHNAPVGKGPLR